MKESTVAMFKKHGYLTQAFFKVATGALSLTRDPQKPVPLDLDIVLEEY